MGELSTGIIDLLRSFWQANKRAWFRIQTIFWLALKLERSVLYSDAPSLMQSNVSFWVSFPDQQGQADLVSKPAFFES